MSVLVRLRKPSGTCSFEVCDITRKGVYPCGKPGAYKHGKAYLCQEHGEYFRGQGGVKVIEEGGKW